MSTSGVVRISQWVVDGGLGADFPAAGDHSESGAKSPALGDFCNFPIKITLFYAYFGQITYFKVVSHQFKSFKISLNVLNRINEEQVL